MKNTKILAAVNHTNSNYREQYKNMTNRNNTKILVAGNNTNIRVTENNCQKYN